MLQAEFCRFLGYGGPATSVPVRAFRPASGARTHHRGRHLLLSGANPEAVYHAAGYSDLGSTDEHFPASWQKGLPSDHIVRLVVGAVSVSLLVQHVVRPQTLGRGDRAVFRR